MTEDRRLTYARLRGMSRKEIIAEHDELVDSTGPIEGPYFLEELARRRGDRQAKTLIALTFIIGVLTAANVWLVWLVYRQT